MVEVTEQIKSYTIIRQVESLEVHKGNWDLLDTAVERRPVMMTVFSGESGIY